MKNILTKALFVVIAVAGIFSSCKEEELRTHYPESMPQIESIKIAPVNDPEASSIAFGDEITVSARIFDPKTPLSTLTVSIIINDEIVRRDSMRTKGKEFDLEKTYKVPLIPYAEDNTPVKISFRAINVEGTVNESVIENAVTADYDVNFGTRIYLVLSDGTVKNTNRRIGSTTSYQSVRLDVPGPTVSFKIAEKLTPEGAIDYSGFVWGNVDGKLAICSEEDPFYELTESLVLTYKNLIFDI